MKSGDGVLGSKSVQPGCSRVNDTASQGEYGYLLVVKTGDALELKMHLALLGALADQAHQPSSQMPDQKQNLKPLARTRARGAQAKTAPFVLDVAERLLDAHSLGVQATSHRLCSVGYQPTL